MQLFFVSPQIVQNVVALTQLFSTCATRWKHVWIHKYLCICFLLICIKGKIVLLLDKTGYVSQETRPKFIDSQNFYFHFHYKLFCIKAVHLSDNIYTSSVFWYNEHKKNLDIHSSMKTFPWRMGRLFRWLFLITPCGILKHGYFIAKTGQFW